MYTVEMENTSNDSISEIKTVNFGSVPVDKEDQKFIYLSNTSERTLSYRVSLMYIMNNIDHVFKLSITSTLVKCHEKAEVKIVFKPNIVGQTFTEYYVIDDTDGNVYRLTVTGKCFGPSVSLSKKKVVFRVCKNLTENRKEIIEMINKTAVDTTYQWLLPVSGQSYFQVSTGNCGLIRAFETIKTTIIFTGTALGVYTSELACLIMHQGPLFMNVLATVVFSGNPMLNIHDHVFEKSWKRKSHYTHLMQNSLNRLSYIPSGSVYERYLDFGTGSVTDVTVNISQILCVTNHEEEDGFMQWVPDPDNVFLIDPIDAIIPTKESRLFTVRFRPKTHDNVFGYLMFGNFQYKRFNSEKSDVVRMNHTWFRIPCIGNTWKPCTESIVECESPTEVTLPPTVPSRTTFTNFMLSNKLEVPMCFKMIPPCETNFVVMPMCGVVPARGWQIMSVALEPISCGYYCETWDLILNQSQKERVCFTGNAEISQVEVMSHGYNPATHAMFEFPPTITGCTNYCTAYLHNLTRMEIHIRILNSVEWLGADYSGTLILLPKEIVRYHWWFFPKVADKVYDTTVTCSCMCLINGSPVGEPIELFIHITGFSELPDLRMLPKTDNLHDVIVGEKAVTSITLYNYGSCYFTSKLFTITTGMGDDHSKDRCEIDSTINSLKPSNHCTITVSVTPEGAGPRQIDIKYTVLFRTEYDEVDETQPSKKKICTIWYDGIYPTMKVKRTISIKCPVILSNHCVWNISNIEEFNKALVDCRPNKPLPVDIYGPDLCVRDEEVEMVFVLGCVYAAPVAWSLRREKICGCVMIEVQTGISMYEMRHNCVHRQLVELSPQNGIVSPKNPSLIFVKLKYAYQGENILRYQLTMPNQRVLTLNIHIYAHLPNKGVLTPMRRIVGENEYLAVLDCGKVPINNLDPVIRILWLYNPTDVFTTWRLLRGNVVTTDSAIRCLLYFAEVPPLGKLAIPFAFMPSEMIDYEMKFSCSFGYDVVKICVTGQGGLPNCVETRLDMPSYVEKIIRSAYRDEMIFLSMEHISLPMMPTHSLSRDIISICNETDHTIRFIWLPERIANIVNIVMTPCWGVINPRCMEWITMTVYTLQEPATFTTTVACEILDLTERNRYQSNEALRKVKIEKCNQEFIITEEGMFHPGINDSPPYVADMKKPQPSYLAMTVSVSSKGQRDGYTRLLLKQLWEQIPPYDLLTSDPNEGGPGGNCMTISDIIQVIDGILWDALHCKMFKNQIQYYAKEEIPTPMQLQNVLKEEKKEQLSRRVTSGICDAIVNKAVFHVYGLNPKHGVPILEAE